MASAAILLVFCHAMCLVLSQDPEFLTSKPQVVAVKGTTAVIPCRVRNIGSYRVLWSVDRVLVTFDTQRIIDDDRISVERPYLTEWNLHIKHVKSEDSGTYQCQVNTNPVTSYEVKLHVLDEAPSPVMPKEVVAFPGNDVEIACKLPDVNDIGTWSYKADEKGERSVITEEGRFRFRAGQGQDSHVHTLVISDAGPSDQGQYFCRARSGTEGQTSLRIVVPPSPPSLEAKAESANQLRVRWRKPSGDTTQVSGYILYVLNHDTGKEHVFEVPVGQGVSGEESFRVGDLTTNTTYSVQLATKLQLGEESHESKRSPQLNITTPLFVPQAPGGVKVKRLTDGEAEVVWSPPPPAKITGIIRGYKVFYTPLGGKKKPLLSQTKTVTVTKPTGSKWKAEMTGLKPKTRYYVRVKGFTHKGEGRMSKTAVYLHKALPPELSLNGRVLSDNSVLLTVTSMGSGKMSNVKMFYTEAKQPSWKRLDFSSEWKFTVVGGLDPETSYFFKVKARIGGRMKQCVTHITTPPFDLEVPQEVKVSATASTSIEVTWDYPGNVTSLPLGYVVILEEIEGGEGEGKSHRQSVVFNRTSVEVKELKPGTRYNIQVCAFNGFGEGPRTDGLLFHIAESGVLEAAVNEPKPPRFTHELPERLEIQSGEAIKITCVADGSPIPDVQWYSNGEPIGVSAQGSNELHLANVITPTVLTCRATSAFGEIEASTKVEVPQSETKPKPLTLTAKTENIKTSTFSIVWTLQGENAQSVDRLEILITDASNRPLLTRTLSAQTRSFHLRSLQPDTEYRAILRAFAASGTGSDGPLAEVKMSAVTLSIDGASVTTTPAPTPSRQIQTQAPETRYRARVALSVMDVTPTSAVLEWDFSGLDPRYVQLYELKVKSRSNFTLLTETLKANLNVMDLTLQPGQIYYVQVRAFDRRGEVLALNVTRVTTPPEDAPTPAPNTGEESPVLRRASLTLSTHAVTGDSARVDWTLSGAQPSDVGQYIIRVKDAQGRTLLRQEMTQEARSLTLSNLTPRTQYTVELQAVDDKGAVITSTSVVLTTTTNTEPEVEADPRKLRVYTEELAKDSVKVAWSTPTQLLPRLSGVVVRMTDIANVTLLTQQMSPLTRSLTVRNLQPGERYQALVQLKGSDGKVVKSGFLAFDTQPTPGMPGRPTIHNVEMINSTVVRLHWNNTPSPSPAAGSEDVTGYVINFVPVDADNEPLSGTYQLPVFGSSQVAVIPNLTAGKRYMFQVAARNKYSFGALSAPFAVQLPR